MPKYFKFFLCFCSYCCDNVCDCLYVSCCVFDFCVCTLIMDNREQANILLNSALMSNKSTSLRVAITLIRVSSSVPAPCNRKINNTQHACITIIMQLTIICPFFFSFFFFTAVSNIIIHLELCFLLFWSTPEGNILLVSC